MSEQIFSNGSSGDNSDSAQDSVVARSVIVPNLDNLLDQIDAVLEKNAEEFVNSFVQKGGQ